MKNTHNKLKNTGLIFELLTRQVTSEIIQDKESKSVDILKKYFTKTELAKELKLYQALASNQSLSEIKANTVITSVLDASKNINKLKLRREKYNLINEIGKVYGVDNFFKTKIDNYKIQASIYSLLETSNSNTFIDPDYMSKCKFLILENLTKKIEDTTKTKNEIIEEFNNQDREIKLLTQKILIEKFNKTYSDKLNSKQKSLLKEYINNISNTEALKNLINSEFGKVKNFIRLSLPKIDDKTTQIKLNEILSNIKDIPQATKLNDNHFLTLMQCYELIEEIRNEI